MNKDDREQIKTYIQTLEEVKSNFEGLRDVIQGRADCTEAHFPSKSDELQAEADTIDLVIDSLDSAITDATDFCEV